MNQFVAPTAFIIEISSFLENIVMRIVFEIMKSATRNSITTSPTLTIETAWRRDKKLACKVAVFSHRIDFVYLLYLRNGVFKL